MRIFDPTNKDIFISTDMLQNIAREWHKFMNGNVVNTSIVPDFIIQSWERSKENQVDPLSDDYNNIIRINGIDKNSKLHNYVVHNTMVNKSIEEIANHLTNLNMIVTYDTKVDDKRLISTDFKDKSIVYDHSESVIGTTSVSLASDTGKSIFFVGAMHYKQAYHESFCFSKPLLHGQSVAGILTISGSDMSKVREAYAFLISLYKIIEKEYFTIISDQDRSKCYKKEGFPTAIYTFDNIIGKNEKITKLKILAKKIASSDLPVLISGESGTGKELFAQSIHNASNRSSKPFVAINCGAIAKELVESELFGYEPGAFTGALKRGKKGKLEAASGGTIFLDEIDSMPLDVQIKLLRAISSNEITKIGDIIPIPIDIRIISATKENLLKKADIGTFREDLYYRIAYFNLEIPPLRERIDDIPFIVSRLVEDYIKEKNHPYIKITDDFIEHLLYYFWRGNIRELRNVVYASIALLGKETELTSDLLPEKIIKAYNYNKSRRCFHSFTNVQEEDYNKSLKEQLNIYEELIIRETLKQKQWNITNTAKHLKISPKSLYRKLEKYPEIKEIERK